MAHLNNEKKKVQVQGLSKPSKPSKPAWGYTEIMKQMFSRDLSEGELREIENGTQWQANFKECSVFQCKAPVLSWLFHSRCLNGHSNCLIFDSHYQIIVNKESKEHGAKLNNEKDKKDKNKDIFKESKEIKQCQECHLPKTFDRILKMNPVEHNLDMEDSKHKIKYDKLWQHIYRHFDLEYKC